MCRELERLWTIQLFLKLLSQGWGDGKIVKDVDGGRWKEKVSSRHYRTDKELNSQRLWQHVQDMYSFKTDKIPALRKGTGHRVLSLTRKLLAIDVFWKEDKPVLPKEYLWAYWPYSRSGSMPRNNWPTHNILKGIFTFLGGGLFIWGEYFLSYLFSFS